MNTITRTALDVLSVSVAAVTFGGIYAVQTGVLELGTLSPLLVTISLIALLRYTVLYYPFENRRRRRALGVICSVLVAGSIVALGLEIQSLDSAQLEQIWSVQHASTPGFLPAWWFGGFLLFAWCCILVGTIASGRVQQVLYPYPRHLEDIDLSAPYYGLGCAFIGFWAVLFVGFRLQRVIVIAPIFEELLKFGVAIIFGSLLFGRSKTARVGVALVIGALFGVVEHGTTYPTESDAFYLYRTLFHAGTTMVSVAAYTTFENREETALRWLAPLYSMIIHFFNNVFSVGFALVVVFVDLSAVQTSQFVYSGVALLLLSILLVLSYFHERTLIKLYQPLANLF